MRYLLDHPKTIEAMEWLYDLAARRRLMTTPDQTDGAEPGDER